MRVQMKRMMVVKAGITDVTEGVTSEKGHQTGTAKEVGGLYTVCEVHDRKEEGRKMAVAAKLGKKKELKLQDKQTKLEDKKKGLAY